MSVLAATTLRERASAKDVPVETVRQGTPKAWTVFNQTGTLANLASFGVSSLVDIGVGVTTINASTAFATANFAVTLARFLTVSATNGNTDYVIQSASSANVRNFENGAQTDSLSYSVSYMGAIS